MFWRDGVVLVGSHVLRLVGVGVMHRRHPRGPGSRFVFVCLLYCAGSVKVLPHTYGYPKVGGVLYLLAIIVAFYYLNTRVLTTDVAWSPADVCFFGGTTFAHIIFNYAPFISLGLSPMVLAVLMIAMQSLIFKAMIPYSKQWLGEHWRLVIVPLILSSELGPAFLLTRLTTIGDIEFWVTLCIQPGAKLSLQKPRLVRVGRCVNSSILWSTD